jgi:hypothetical protein
MGFTRGGQTYDAGDNSTFVRQAFGDLHPKSRLYDCSGEDHPCVPRPPRCQSISRCRFVGPGLGQAGSAATESRKRHFLSLAQIRPAWAEPYEPIAHIGVLA